VVVTKVGKEGDCSNNYTCSNFLLFGRKHGTRHLGSAGRFTAHSPIINVTDKSTPGRRLLSRYRQDSG